MTDARVLLDKDYETHIARLTLNNPARKNSYDPEMRRAMRAAKASSPVRSTWSPLSPGCSAASVADRRPRSVCIARSKARLNRGGWDTRG